MAKWYYTNGPEKFGPLADEEIARLVEKGEIDRDTLMWCKGLTEWEKAGGLTFFVDLLDSMPPPLPDAEKLEAKKPPSAASNADMRYAQLNAGVWSRFFARNMDYLLLGPTAAVLTMFFMEWYGRTLPGAAWAVRALPYDSAKFVLVILYSTLTIRILLLLEFYIFNSSWGKWSYGISVQRPLDQNRLYFYFNREFALLISGEGFHIPVLQQLSQFFQYLSVRANGKADYDSPATVITQNFSLPRCLSGWVVTILIQAASMLVFFLIFGLFRI